MLLEVATQSCHDPCLQISLDCGILNFLMFSVIFLACVADSPFKYVVVVAQTFPGARYVRVVVILLKSR